MATRFVDKSTNEIVEFTSPDEIASAVASPDDFDPVLPAGPRLFVDKQTNEPIWAYGQQTESGFRASPDFRQPTQQEYADVQFKQAEDDRRAGEKEGRRLASLLPQYSAPGFQQIGLERVAAEEEAGRQYMLERPVRGAIGTAAMEAFRLGYPVVGQAALERFGGLTAEQQEEYAQQFPTAGAVGKGLGVVGAIAGAVASGGLSAGTQITGRGLVGAIPVALSPVGAAAGRVAGATAQAIKSIAPGLAGTVTGEAALGAAGGLASAAAITEPFRLVENKIAARDTAGESIVANLGMAGLLGGALSSIAPAASKSGTWLANTDSAKNYANWLSKRRAERIFREHAPERLPKIQRQIGRKDPQKVYDLANEAADEGLVGPFMSPIRMFERTRERMDEVGEQIGRIAGEADATLGKPVDSAKLWDSVVDDVISPLSRGGGIKEERVARELMDELASYRNAYGDSLTATQMKELRTKFGAKAFGSMRNLQDPMRDETSRAYAQMRDLFTDKLGETILSAGIRPSDWYAANRAYQVAKTAEGIASSAIGRSAREHGVDTYDALSNAVSVATGFLSGPWSGIVTKVASAAAKQAVPRGFDWMNAATRRAIESKAPSRVIQGIKELADEQQSMARGEMSQLAVKPGADAKRDFLEFHGRLTEAVGQPMPKSYRAAIEDARRELEQGYDNAWYSVDEPGGLSVDRLGDSLERARSILTKASVPTRASASVPKTESTIVAQEPYFQAMRELRDDMTISLANSNAIWGNARLAKRDAELRRLLAAYTDPARLAKLQSINEVVGKTKRAVQQKGSRLMNAASTSASRAISKEDRDNEDFYNETLENSEVGLHH